MAQTIIIPSGKKPLKILSLIFSFSYHSCGYIEPFIPDLIEAGIDILNPIQPESMSFEKIHSEYGNVLSFWGTIGTQDNNAGWHTRRRP